MLLSHSNFFIVPSPSADHPIQIQTEIPTPGIWPLQFPWVWGISQMLNVLLGHPSTTYPASTCWKRSYRQKHNGPSAVCWPKNGVNSQRYHRKSLSFSCCACMISSDAAASDGKRLAVLALNSNQPQKTLYKEETLAWQAIMGLTPLLRTSYDNFENLLIMY